jgi:hypothetical protein
VEYVGISGIAAASIADAIPREQTTPWAASARHTLQFVYSRVFAGQDYGTIFGTMIRGDSRRRR